MEKKKNKHFIIPPSYFKARGITPVPVVKPIPVKSPEIIINPSVISKEEKSTGEVTELEIPKISIQNPTKVTSGLSLKSIREKKEHLIKQMDVVIDEEQLPREPVTEEAFTSAWKDYIKSLHHKGEKIMASILEMEAPKLKGTNICLEYANETLKIELERAQFPLLQYLRRSLKNYDLKLEVSVNEEVAKKYAFTPQEKYERLNGKNPNLELLKKTFGLDF
jgi:DNA polymerase-3 subunit gamma/tau